MKNNQEIKGPGQGRRARWRWPQEGHAEQADRRHQDSHHESLHAHSITSSARASRQDGEAERLGGLEIEHQIELGRLHHW